METPTATMMKYHATRRISGNGTSQPTNRDWKATPIMASTTPAVGNSESHTFKRTGDAPLIVTGRTLDSKSVVIKDREDGPSRTFFVHVVEADSGKFVVGVSYLTTWDSESSIHKAAICDDATTVRKAIRAYSLGIASMPIGFPAGDKFRDRQTNLVRELIRRFDEVASKILDRPEFAEKV